MSLWCLNRKTRCLPAKHGPSNEERALKGIYDYVSLHFESFRRCFLRLDIRHCSVDKINVLNMSETPKLPETPSELFLQ